MSAFDPATFMNTETTDSNATTFTPFPEGDFQAAIKEVVAAEAGGKPVLNIIWTSTAQEAVDATGMETPQVRQTIWLDLTAQGGLDNGKGKNVGLGKLREALGQNTPGQRWSPGMLVGQVASIKVAHRSGKEPGEVFADVKSVTAL